MSHTLRSSVYISKRLNHACRCHQHQQLRYQHPHHRCEESLNDVIALLAGNALIGLQHSVSRDLCFLPRCYRLILYPNSTSITFLQHLLWQWILNIVTICGLVIDVPAKQHIFFRLFFLEGGGVGAAERYEAVYASFYVRERQKQNSRPSIYVGGLRLIQRYNINPWNRASVRVFLNH